MKWFMSGSPIDRCTVQMQQESQQRAMYAKANFKEATVSIGREGVIKNVILTAVNRSDFINTSVYHARWTPGGTLK